MTKKPRAVYGPCSERQKLILQDNTTDVILMGGGRLVPPR
jgi:hypothetical protein